MFIQIIIIFGLTTLLRGDFDCNIKEGQKMRLSEVLPCLRSIKLTPEEKQITLETLKNYFDGYSFRDIYLNQTSISNSYGGESINIFRRLDDIAVKGYDNTFDFYGDIVKLANSLHCAHTSFSMPCVDTFAYYLPIYFNFVQDPSGGPNRAFVKQIIYDYADYVPDIIIDKEVLYVNLDGNEIDPNVSPSAEEAIKIWADKQEHISRNPYGRWQYAQSGSFYYRSMSSYPLPQSEYIKIRIKISEDETQDIDVPYLVYAIADVNDLEEYCQVDPVYLPDPDTANDNKSNTKKIPRKQTPKNTTTPVNKKELAKKLKDLMKKNEKDTLIKEKDRIDPLWRERQKKIIEITKDSLKYASQGNRKVDLDEGLDYIAKKRIESLKKLSQYVNQNRSSTFTGKFKGKSSKRGNEIDIKTVNITSDGSLTAFHLSEYELGVIYITNFLPQDINEFQSTFFDIINQLSDTKSNFYSKKLLIDLRYNGGGSRSLSPILTRFLFPNANSPLWEPYDYVKSPITSIEGIISDFYIKQDQYEGGEIQIDEQTGEIIYDYYKQNGPQRRTTYDSGSGLSDSITVDLTKRSICYGGHQDQLRQIARRTDWHLRRKMIWQPKDVTILLEGRCISTCGDFAKVVHQKRVGRIVAVGNFGGVQNGARYNAGTAGGSTVFNSGNFEDRFYQYLNGYFDGIDFGEKGFLDLFPGLFYRNGTSLTFVNSEFYGITDKTKDTLSEFYIYDADFHINHVENFLDEKSDLQILAGMYVRVITEIDSTLNGESSQLKKNADQSGCFSGEVEINGWLSQKDCLDKVRSDPDSIYGYRCDASEERNADGTRSVGKFVRSEDGCIFSHCRPGYSRIGKNCVKELILHEEGKDKEEIWPELLEKEYHDQLESEKDPMIPDPVKPEEEKVDKANSWKAVGIFFIVFSSLLIVALIIIVVVFITISRNKKNQNNNVELQDQSNEPLVYQNPLHNAGHDQNMSDE